MRYFFLLLFAVSNLLASARYAQATPLMLRQFTKENKVFTKSTTKESVQEYLYWEEIEEDFQEDSDSHDDFGFYFDTFGFVYYHNTLSIVHFKELAQSALRHSYSASIALQKTTRPIYLSLRNLRI